MAANYEQKTVKPANDAYTGMLAISLISLLVGCGVLYLDYSQYAGEMPKKVDYNYRDRPLPDYTPRDASKAPVDTEPDEKKDNPDGKLR
ncbi:MAG TPA: hypothetical protein VE988_03070 [Gemmataceae bacterium]|nr:hypothetical protein [Gemmataceae bacterium]